MNKGKGFRFSIKSKILFGSIIINVLICIVMGITIYRIVSERYIKTASEDTLALTKVAAYQINGNLLALLNVGSDESYANTVIQEEMRQVEENSHLSAIYTIGERNGKYMYLSQPASTGILIGENIDSIYLDEVKNAFANGGSVSGNIEKGKDGNYFISAYAPVTNKDGKIVGLLGLDYIVNDLVESLNRIIESIAIIGLILLTLSVVVSVLLAAGITNGLKVVNSKVSDLVSNNGDLTRKIEVKNNDEVRDIAENINSLLEYIRNVVRSISGSSVELTSSVESALLTTTKTNDQLNGVSDTMEQMSAAMQETSASLQQVQTSTNRIKGDIQEMFQNVQDGTKYAGEMEERAVEMRKHAESETEAAKQAVEDMTASMTEKIEKSKAVENISNLTKTILNIASKTNLLALNASIEAARAGEQGRGFAVVAEEISVLAANSADTAKKIQIISEEVVGNVKDLADESTKMVDFVKDKTIGGYQKLMDTGVQYQSDAEMVSDMLRNVENASKNIDNSMEVVSTAVNDVTTAVEDSAHGIVDVVRAVSDMSDNMKENMSLADANEKISQRLDAEVNRFKF